MILSQLRLQLKRGSIHGRQVEEGYLLHLLLHCITFRMISQQLMNHLMVFTYYLDKNESNDMCLHEHYHTLVRFTLTRQVDDHT